MMVTNPSPTVRKRRLAKLMRRFRDEAEKTREQAAKHVDVAARTITRMEEAKTTLNATVVAELCRFYGLSEAQAQAMATLAREARRRGWWHQHSSSIPDWFEVYVGLEEEVSEVRTYQPENVFGLFQTESYIRGLMRSEVNLPEDEMERRIALRLKRQERLTGPDAPKLWVVLNEAALRRRVGGTEAMLEQLRHLAELSRSLNVTIQVLAFAAGAHPATDGAFEVLRFPDAEDPDVVYVQYRLGSLYLEEQSQIAEYTDVFDHLRARALGPDESRDLIMQVISEIT